MYSIFHFLRICGAFCMSQSDIIHHFICTLTEHHRPGHKYYMCFSLWLWNVSKLDDWCVLKGTYYTFPYSLSYIFKFTILDLCIGPIKEALWTTKPFFIAHLLQAHHAAAVHLLSPSLQTEVIYSSSDSDLDHMYERKYFLVFLLLTSSVCCPSAGFWKVDFSELRGCMNGQRDQDCF